MERKHRRMIEMARTFLLDAYIPRQFWVDAAYAATSIINRLPIPLLDGHSPYQKFFTKFQITPFYGCLGVNVFQPFYLHIISWNLSLNNVFSLGMPPIIRGIDVSILLQAAFILVDMFCFMRMFSFT